MNLDINNWKEFILNKLFIIKYGVNLELNACEETTLKEKSSVNFVSRTAENNGVSSRVSIIEEIEPQNAGLISVAGGGSVLSAFLQNEPFYSGRDLYTLEAKENISDNVKMFIITIIEQNKYKYSYGRQANKTLPYLKLKLPIQCNENSAPIIDETKKYSEEGYIPDWKWMEDYIISLHHKPLTTKNKPNNSLSLNVDQWKEFKIGTLFRIESTKGKVTDDLVEGKDLPYIAAKHDMNGFEMMCSSEGMNDYISEGNCIVFVQIGEGSCGYANYMMEPFIGMSGKTCCGYIDGVLNQYIGLFLSTILCQERPKHSFGRSWTGDRLFDTIIKLPVQHNSDGTISIDDKFTYSEKGYIPDWEFMENFIKSLPYGDRI